MSLFLPRIGSRKLNEKKLFIARLSFENSYYQSFDSVEHFNKQTIDKRGSNCVPIAHGNKRI